MRKPIAILLAVLIFAAGVCAQSSRVKDRIRYLKQRIEYAEDDIRECAKS